MPRPDAIRWPRKIQAGPDAQLPHTSEDKDAIVSLAEQHLECRAIELAWVRCQLGEYFATRDPRDTLLYPFGHAQEAQPRYRWDQQPGGIFYGYLIDGAKAD